MSGSTKLMTAGGGGVSLTPASSIASDVTVNVPVTGVSGGTLVCSDSSGNVTLTGSGQLRSNASLTPVVFAGSTGTEVGKLARAWCNYNAGTNTIITSFNVSSVTVNAAGDYTFNYTNALPTSNNAVFAEGSGDGGSSSPDLYGGTGTNTTTSVRIYGYGSGKFANTMVVFA